MPFSSLFASGNNEASSSRKRSYAEITGSESHSQSPQITSSKRRRTGPTASLSSNFTRNHISSPYSFTLEPESAPERYEPPSREYQPMSEEYQPIAEEHQPVSEEYQPWPERGRYEPVSERFEGDGLDYRRPVMSASAATQTGNSTVIDLTADDSTEPSPQPEASEVLFGARNRRRTGEERWNEAAETRRSVSRGGEERTRLRNIEREATLARIQYARNRGPRFGRDIIGDDVDDLEVINLVDSDDTEEMEAEHDLDFGEDLFGDPDEFSSQEITFLGERPAPAEDLERIPSRNNHRRLPTPQNYRGGFLPNTFQNLREFVRQGTFGYRGLSNNEIDDASEAIDRETLDRIDGIRELHPNHRNRERARGGLGQDMRAPRMPFGDFPMVLPPRPNSIDIPDFIDVDELEMDMNLDYENTAFQVGDPDRLEIIEPPIWPAMNAGRGDTPIELVKEPYLRPRARAEGFTMNFAEHDVLECPNCQEELSVGSEGSAKEQVWMIKTCGHVYCGECAINRAVSTRKKEKGKRVEPNVTPFKKCLVADCGKSVIGKAAMFQVYL